MVLAGYGEIQLETIKNTARHKSASGCKNYFTTMAEVQARLDQQASATLK